MSGLLPPKKQKGPAKDPTSAFDALTETGLPTEVNRQLALEARVRKYLGSYSELVEGTELGADNILTIYAYSDKGASKLNPFRATIRNRLPHVQWVRVRGPEKHKRKTSSLMTSSCVAQQRFPSPAVRARADTSRRTNITSRAAIWEIELGTETVGLRQN